MNGTIECADGRNEETAGRVERSVTRRHRAIRAATKILPHILEQHASEAAAIWALRDGMVDAPHVTLADLSRFDERLDAQLAGLRLAGQDGLRVCEVLLDAPGPGEVFAATAMAIAMRDPEVFDRLFALTAAMPEVRRGLWSATGWAARANLSGLIVDWLDASDEERQLAGVVACSLHRVDPGERMDALIRSPHASVRARAARLIGELGAVSRRGDLVSMLHDDDPGVESEAARAAVLLGERGSALARLAGACVTPGSSRVRRLEVALRALQPEAARALLRSLKSDPSNLRDVATGAGMSGDARYVPALIEWMADPVLARVAGESFSLITGVDLERSGMVVDAPGASAAGPNDDPADADVAPDPDEHLPWPAADAVARWWEANRSRFERDATWFLGELAGKGVALRVLREGRARERRAAAVALKLRMPDQRLFVIAAPAGRQRARLGLHRTM